MRLFLVIRDPPAGLVGLAQRSRRDRPRERDSDGRRSRRSDSSRAPDLRRLRRAPDSRLRFGAASGYFPTMTSLALMKAVTASPSLSFIRSTDAREIVETIV